MSSSLSLSSPQLSLTRNWKHHIFPSFHGPDVRRSFLAHILKEFRSKGIEPFIDNDIERSKSIGPELVEAIRGSRIAIVLLSKKYASSTWCLDELVEIIKCREVLGQTVMTIFYEVDPTDVKKQTGPFGKVFRNTCKGKTEDDIGRWKHALAEVATIAGYHSRNWNNEAEMIENIATDVSNALNNSTLSTDFDGLVGMETHMFNMRSLLRPDLDEVRMIGIWGPSGIGKTTIARFLFNQYSKDFPHCVFMENVKGVSLPICSDNHRVMLDLQEKFMSKITNNEVSKIPNLGVIKDRFKDKKVLAVLDDVDRPVQLEAMAKETSWFGPGSRIIITTQDRKLLQASGVEHIYNVEFLSDDEAFQMFCMYAFGQDYPKDGFRELAEEVTRLAGELPLGLRVMGSYFQGMSNVEDWKKALPMLKTSLDGEIESILKLSYDALHDEDKNLFLHIACFFHFESVDTVKGCLANSLLVRNVTHRLDVLTEKSLISVFFGWVIMHNLLVQLGREIVRRQSINKPGERQFLVDIRDIEEVLSDDKADTGNVIGIDLRSSFDNKEDIAFTSEGAFERFYNLQFLRIIGVNLLNSLPRKLRFLSLDKKSDSSSEYPLPCFPSDFQPKFLVKLSMVNCQFEKLWEEIDQPLNNLKCIDLSGSIFLKVLPDLSTATNLCKLHVVDCSSLVEFPSIGKAIYLRELNLRGCSSLVKLHPSIGNLINLEKFHLSDCLSLVELPSSIGDIIHLRELDLCTNLVKLPSSIGNLINLEEFEVVHQNLFLKLSKLRLAELPSSFGNLVNLKKVRILHSRLVKLPSSFGNLTNLQELNLSYSKSLVELPSLINFRRLSKLGLHGCSKLMVYLTNINLESLHELVLSGCFLLKIEDLKPNETTIKEVPSSMMPLLSEMELSSSCETQELGPWIGRISRLRRLVLNNMHKLVSLPQLPYSIEELDASYCLFLKRLDCSFLNPNIRLDFAQCYKLNQEARDLLIHTRTNKYAVLPGREVPACFTYRASGSSLTVKLNQNPLHTSTKFKACFILAGKGMYNLENSIGAKVYCRIMSKHTVSLSNGKPLLQVHPEHLYTFEVEATEVTSTELVFEFEIRNSDDKTWEIKECGIFELDGEASGECMLPPQDSYPFLPKSVYGNFGSVCTLSLTILLLLIFISIWWIW